MELNPSILDYLESIFFLRFDLGDGFFGLRLKNEQFLSIDKMLFEIVMNCNWDYVFLVIFFCNIKLRYEWTDLFFFFLSSSFSLMIFLFRD